MLPSLLFLCYVIVQDKNTDNEALESSVEDKFVTEESHWPLDGDLIDMDGEGKVGASWRGTMESRSDHVSSVCSALPPSSLVLQQTKHSGTKVQHGPIMGPSSGSPGWRVGGPATPGGVHPPQDGGRGVLEGVPLFRAPTPGSSSHSEWPLSAEGRGEGEPKS